MFARTLTVTARRATLAGANPAVRAKHTLPDLDYPYDALEPVISAKIMKLHHTKHHATYVAGLNAAEEKLKAAQSSNDVQAQVAIQPLLRFHGGGHVNHTIFWKNLIGESNGGGQLHDGVLKEAIDKQFGGKDKLSTVMNNKAAGIQGSGWAWLTLNAKGELDVITTANQDMAASVGHVPLLGIDAWEHAFYLDYMNVKMDYFKNIWRVVNWKDVARRYDEAVAQQAK
ncbi:Superoxide dismutase [Mn], mitochondrial [Coemansia sp. RSA 1822]|nr:Superoxide dismutase [Mn], mitochondrial [Coemansia sp. RSA 638]KAJ2120552.1 Superoxide dismutase [Mn], mitochondrial [Coemansia sp. RSA 720]KAJ2540001.1 Superoxide dismutase [Mn], mitochondrial [Coemansia sp. RSA 1853]KAJ2560264.1 Superoxide dismutase [Mn], mitochondrial [Coemansia sp. RSA 1822]KAJ2656961.1 Superoxide dismutase [Mn], mitochondrial [Coemansia sp. RSA 1199]